MLARYLTVEHGVPTLFIANKKVLLDDALNDFKEGIEGLYDSDISQIKDGMFGDINLRKKNSYTEDDLRQSLKNKKIIVATIQSLFTRLEDEKTKGALIDWLRNHCKFVMIDEAQAINDKQWMVVLNEVHAPLRVALSATPRRTDGSTLLIYSQTGKLAYDTSADEQIAQGRLCELDIQYWPFDHKLYNDNDNDLNYAETYSSCIVENEERNRFIIERTLEMLDEERQVLVLIQFIEHGHILKDLFLQKGIELEDIRFVWGDTKDKARQEAISDFRAGKYKIFIGSTIADVGMNIASISGVVLAGAGNGEVTHIQRIGRGSRTFDYLGKWGYEPKFIKDNNGVKVTRIVDILDTNVAFFKRQSKNRFYTAAEEFGADRVHIVGADQSIFRHRAKKKDNVSKVDDTGALSDMFSAFKNIDREEINNAQTETNSQVADFLKAFRR